MTKVKNRNKNKNRNIIIYILAGVIILVGLILFGSFYTNTNTIYQPDTNLYTSKILKFTIEIPSKYYVDDEGITMNLIKNKGEINIGRNGTNYQNLEGYLSDLSLKNKIVLVDKQSLTIDNNEAIKTIIKHPISGNTDSLAYFIYKNNFVYRFSTSSPELYSDLDKIARSFRYTP